MGRSHLEQTELSGLLVLLCPVSCGGFGFGLLDGVVLFGWMSLLVVNGESSKILPRLLFSFSAPHSEVGSPAPRHGLLGEGQSLQPTTVVGFRPPTPGQAKVELIGCGPWCPSSWNKAARVHLVAPPPRGPGQGAQRELCFTRGVIAARPDHFINAIIYSVLCWPLSFLCLLSNSNINNNDSNNSCQQPVTLDCPNRECASKDWMCLPLSQYVGPSVN